MTWTHVDIRAFGGVENLELVHEESLPEPGPGQVRVKVLSAGTGFTDCIIRRGQYVQVRDKPPFTIGYDWFGVVDELGEGVSGLRRGQFVADMPVIGGYTQYLCADAERLVVAPEGLDPAQAVCMILSYTTAYQMLTRVCRIPRGAKCLVHAAGGAVGTALLELGRLMGLEMYGTASQAKKSVVESMGATHIDYRSEDFVARSLALSEGGLDVVFDTIGAGNWSRSYRCLRRGGTLIAYGAMQVTTGEERIPQLLLGFARLFVLWRMLPDGKHSTFYNIQSRREKRPQEFREDLQRLFAMLKDGKLQPAIAARLPLEQAAEAHRLIEAAQVNGKIVLMCADT